LAKLEQKDDLRVAVKGLAGLFDAARGLIADEKGPQPERLVAVRLLGRGLDHQTEDRTVLTDLLTPRRPEEMQSAAAATLGRSGNPESVAVLLGGWKGYSPALRAQVLEVLLRRQEGVKAVLDAAEKRQVEPFEIDAVRRQQLLQHKDAALRERAVKLFRDAISPNRQKVIDSYRDALTLTGDAKRGAEVFGKHCAACHKLGNVGQAVGPDLASVGDKSPEGLLIAILDPNRSVEARYVNYQATTKNGQTFSGVLMVQTATSITLVSAAGKEQVILRTDLDELTSSGKSAMPEGLEKEVSQQALADLIAHLRSGEKPPQRKTFEGNHPAVVTPASDGSLLLTAKLSEVYGSTLVLEKTYGNLGWWSSEDDHAIWTVEVPKAGKYEVWLDYACEDKSSGNRWVLTAGTERLTGVVGGTGTWDTYKQLEVGELTLTEGRQRLVFRSVGKVAGALIDLRMVRLAPKNSP
jgi:putative heme-binding domain-containing protein